MNLIKPQKLNSSGKKAIIAPFRWLLVQGLFFFISAGSLNIKKAWFYFIPAFIISCLSATIMWRLIPELANQRGEFKKDTKKWDKILVSAFLLISITALPAVSGLDVGRYKWSHLSFNTTIIGVVIYCASVLLNHWAMLVNRHFEGTVRIQKDREHKVIAKGPYRFVRHPGYVAMILTTVSFPLIVGSLYGLYPASLVISIIIIRTAMEDATLQKELDGYKEYAAKTRFRLLPGIW
jgi:protein-S-isoprenylcysteine O-methyltransferase Ste14